MPQENHILRCFSCETFQVHIVKKSKKWECKICGAKQSFKRHYGKGTGKDCRNQVMKLNEVRVTKSSLKSMRENEKYDKPFFELGTVSVEKKLVSKWAPYLDKDISSDENEDFKPQKKRKMCEDKEEVKNICEELVTEADRLSNHQPNMTGNSIPSDGLWAEEGPTERKKSKNIFDTGLDNAEDFLNFI